MSNFAPASRPRSRANTTSEWFEGLARILRTLDALLRPRLLVKDEIEEWTRVAALFLDQSFWQSVEDLVARGMLKSEINGAKDVYNDHHAMWARGLPNRVVIPFLNGRLK